ncbi:unnamed protein product [Cyclocybe aegerita]|uniref:Reverse transcriptase/retrotransposon-derived protein RNase H-like domain-containing protein n=1 Tax=Cyclocybe aegerita TaxID=1973307 RepID=A0A8S0XF96_CYCAE|nr:unnamed protein product [Cyclocybe aegerita]
MPPKVVPRLPQPPQLLQLPPLPHLLLWLQRTLSPEQQKSLSGHLASTLPATPVIAESPPVPPDPPAPPYEPSPTSSTPLPHISLINAVAFTFACCLPGSVSFQLALSEDGSVLACSLATDNPEPVDLSSVLEDYYDFLDVFSKSKADTLTPHRPYNLKIDLEEDYHGLNKVTKKDRYPLPLISDLLDAPGKAKVFTKIDLWHAYHLVRIADAAFQRFMNDIFSDLINVSVIVYLDNILIYSLDLTSHKEHPDKCEWHTDRVEYLGYILSADGLSMAADKVKIIQDWPKLQKVKDIQSFLGFANFYRRFIYNYSDICVPLTWLTRKGVPFKFSDEAWELFNYLKKAFTMAPILTQWIPDRPIILETDASDYALAAILSIELTNGEIHPVAFHSQMFNPTKLNYDIHDKELFTIYESFQIWRHYLEGSGTPINIVTDHKKP